MFINLLLLIAALVLLAGGAELLVRGAVSLARTLGVSNFFIGLSIVAFGTSVPELFASGTAALSGHGAIALGNVIGSNICNIALILALTAIICPIAVQLHVVRGAVIAMIGVALLPLTALLWQSTLTRWHGVLMLIVFVIYLINAYRRGRRENAAELAAITEEIERMPVVSQLGKTTAMLISIVLVIVGLALLGGGARLLIDSAVEIAEALGVPPLVIGLTIVAGGTSVPELFASVFAAIRKHPDIAVANVLGSNVFNIAMILGVTTVLAPQQLSAQVLWLDLPVMIALSLACLPIVMTHRRVSRAEGIGLLGVYAVYMIAQFILAPQWFGG